MQRTRKISNLEIGIGLTAVISVLFTLLSFEYAIILLILIFIAVLIYDPPEFLHQLLIRYVDKITHKQRLNIFGNVVVLDKSIKISKKMLEEMFRNALKEA